MGRLQYDGSSDPITIDDEMLAHLKIVIGTKLRRQESFLMTWLTPEGSAEKRRTVWIHPAIPLQFGFDESVLAPIDPQRIADLMGPLNATGELVLDQFVPRTKA